MEIRTKNPNGAVGSIYGTIATVGSKTKHLDFRNNLTLAYLEDYASIQGAGGAKHAQASGIKLLILEKEEGAKESRTASANIRAHMIDKVMEVCKANITAPVYENPAKGKAATEKAAVYNGVSTVYDGLGSLYGMVCGLSAGVYAMANGLMRGFANIVKGKAMNGNPLAEVGSAIKNAIPAFQVQPGSYNSFPANTPYMEYSYHQSRVYADDNKYDEKTGRYKNGYVAPVSVLDITRKQFRKNGEIAGNPWKVTISNFKAPPIRRGKGLTNFDGDKSKWQNEVTLFFELTDDDMWRCCYAVQHFISVWENAFGIPLVQNGVAVHENQVNSFRNAQGGYSNSSYNEADNGYDDW